MELVIKNENNPYEKLNLHAGLLSLDVIRTVIDKVRKRSATFAGNKQDDIGKYNDNDNDSVGIKLSDEQLKRLESLWKEDLSEINAFPYVSNHSSKHMISYIMD